MAQDPSLPCENNRVHFKGAEMMQPETIMKRAGGPTSAVDRLSALPDALLHPILSFLPSPQVVCTCLLSQRRRHLWRSAPHIKIDQRDFGISRRTARSALDERWERFEDFATNLLLFHDNSSSLDELLVYTCVYKQCHVDRWIRRGIEYCPTVLRILIVDFSINLPPMVSSSFRRLRTLRLFNVDLDSQFADLLSACPVMEDLERKVCMFSGDCSQAITSPTLKKLVLGNCDTSHPIVITAPSLSCLELTYRSYQEAIILSKMDSLAEAMIDMTENLNLSQKAKRRLLGSLFNITSLELSGFEAEVMLNMKSDTFPTFCNMRTLCLNNCFLNGCDLNDKLEALGSFLQNAPCLEKLILLCCVFISSSASEWTPERKNITLQRQDRRKTFQCHKLMLIEIIYDHEHDHRLIELVWSLGRSLPDVNIELTKNDDDD